MLDKNRKALLALVRKSLWGQDVELPDADWEAVERCAQEQGVLWMGMSYINAKVIHKKALESLRTFFAAR